MDKDNRGKGLTAKDPRAGDWVVMLESFDPHCPGHSGPGGRAGILQPGAMGVVLDASPDWVGVWWLGFGKGHDLGWRERNYSRPAWASDSDGYWVCGHQLRWPPPTEENEITRSLLAR